MNEAFSSVFAVTLGRRFKLHSEGCFSIFSHLLVLVRIIGMMVLKWDIKCK